MKMHLGYAVVWSGKNRGDVGRGRLVMEQRLGRRLLHTEAVHHKNGDKLDDRLENLELWDRSHPPGQRVEDQIGWATAFLKRWGYVVTRSVEPEGAADFLGRRLGLNWGLGESNARVAAAPL